MARLCNSDAPYRNVATPARCQPRTKVAQLHQRGTGNAMQHSLNADAKDSVRQQWNRMAQGWSDSSAIIRPWLREATQAMLAMAGVKPGAHVLDVAAGAGDQTIDIAEHVGPGGHVLATDLSPEILRYAERNVADAGHRHVET